MTDRAMPRGGGDPGVLMIVGTSFCGSTLLATLLDSHPEIVSTSEMQGPMGADPAEYRCSCGETMPGCPFWSRMSGEMGRRGAEFSIDRWEFLYSLGHNRLTRHLLVRSLRSRTLDALRDACVYATPGWGRKLREIGSRNQAFVESALAITGKRVFVDATKDPLRPRYIEKTTRFRPRVIHLVRDAPGFVNSHIKNTGGSAESGVSLWNRMAGHATRLFADWPRERSMRLRYEDLCADPRAALRRITELVSVEPYPVDFDPASGEHHIIGNRMRMRPLEAISLDERWRDQLPQETLRMICRRTRRFRRLFAYA